MSATEKPNFDNMYADAFQCPYCKEPFKFQRVRGPNKTENSFRIARRGDVETHLEQYHSDKPGLPKG